MTSVRGCLGGLAALFLAGFVLMFLTATATADSTSAKLRSRNRDRVLGAVVGKALEPLPHGTGVVQVLVTLQ